MRTFCLALAILNLLSLSAEAATSGSNTGTSTITFSTITGGGTCTTTVTSPIQIGAAAGIDPSTAIGKDWVGLSPTAFNVSLTNCAGLAASTLTPYITLTGTTLTTKSAAANDRLFSTGTNTTGFGVIIYNTGTPNTTGTTNIATKSGGTIPIPSYGKGTALNSNVTVPLKAAVGCGALADCAGASLKPGSLSASITFGFAYK